MLVRHMIKSIGPIDGFFLEFYIPLLNLYTLRQQRVSIIGRINTWKAARIIITFDSLVQGLVVSTEAVFLFFKLQDAVPILSGSSIILC